jgi:hypothetical protein
MVTSLERSTHISSVKAQNTQTALRLVDQTIWFGTFRTGDDVNKHSESVTIRPVDLFSVARKSDLPVIFCAISVFCSSTDVTHYMEAPFFRILSMVCVANRILSLSILETIGSFVSARAN